MQMEGIQIVVQGTGERSLEGTTEKQIMKIQWRTVEKVQRR